MRKSKRPLKSSLHWNLKHVVIISSPLVQHMMAVIQRTGQTPKLSASSTNANIPLSLGIPSITIGSGGIAGGAHSLGEWFVNKDGYIGIQNALLILLAEAGLD